MGQERQAGEMNFEKYQHVERFGTGEVDGINIGKCYVFPKIDGANASVWMHDDGRIGTGSRNNEITGTDSIKGFTSYIESHDGVKRFFDSYPNCRLFGEWLIPHTLKTYRDDAWRKFYVFDVLSQDGYIAYDVYAPILENLGIMYVPALAIINNPSVDQLVGLLETNSYLIKDGCGVGEGIVIKNYDYKNKYGRVTWAKIVRNEFKEDNKKSFGIKETQGANLVEYEIAAEPILGTICQKVLANIKSECGGWESRYVPRLLGTVWHDLVYEECWSWLKKHRNPAIDFKLLQKLVERKTKEYLPEIFS